MNTSDPHELKLPRGRIDRFVEPLQRFMHIEAASGVVLLGCTLLALALANSPLRESVHHFWEMPVGFSIGSWHLEHSLHHWINDGLMTVFFFVIGLEVKREIVHGELRDLRNAALPIAGALGGMVVPAGLYLVLQWGEPGQHGWGIPMATDIAFVVGCMLIMGSRVPHGLRIMMLTLAIADDIGAILVIAIGYTSGINWLPLSLGVLGILVVWQLAQLGVRSFGVYWAVGALVWLAFFESGVHATLAGVIMGLMTPTRAWMEETAFADILDRATVVLRGGGLKDLSHRGERLKRFQWATRELVPPSEYLESALHPWVGFVIMPLFALANAGVEIELSGLKSPLALAVVAGLVIGKPLGIVGACWLAVRLRIAQLPAGVSWGLVVAGGVLGGIGFTMALFVASLALDKELLDPAKVGVLIGSAISMVAGATLLWWFGLPTNSDSASETGDPDAPGVADANAT